MTDLRYPVGPFEDPGPADAATRARWIAAIRRFPADIRAAVAGLPDPRLDTPYRPGGWTVRQVVHHVVDSHINAYVRIRLALTEDHPTIKPYDEARWAASPDYARPVAGALDLLELLHERWATVLDGLDDAAFRRTYYHPEDQASVSVERAVAMYAWHGRHHLAHITSLRTREGW
jgi:hypothetical protein